MRKSAILLLTLLFMPALAFSQSGLFTTGGTFPVGRNPGSLVAVDLNNDGKLDLVTANNGDNTVTVLLGDGSGRFASAATFAAGIGPAQVLSADFNRDGKPDLAVLTSSSKTLTILLGDGSGGFTAAPATSLGSFPTSMALADFNLDGTPDLAIANQSGVVSIYLGDGSGGFSLVLPTLSPAGAVGVSIAAADFDGDGNPDLVVIPATSNASLFYIYLGAGPGGFTAPLVRSFFLATAPTQFALTVGDFNADGRPDVAAITNFGGVLLLLLSDNQQVLRAYNPNFGLLAFSYSAAAADFNGDGKLDLALTDFAGNVPVLLGDGSASPHFTAAAGSPFAVGQRPVVAVGDFNGDGKPDIAAASDSGNSVTVLLNAIGSGTTPQTITFPPLSDQPYSPQGALTLTASASSGLPVLFSTGSSACAVSGGKVSLRMTGTCTITASQFGNAVYAPAVPVTQSFTIYPGPQTITFVAPSPQVLGTGPVALSAQSSAGPTIDVTFTSNTPAVCTISAHYAVLVSVGTCTVTATSPAAGYYATAVPVTVSFAVVSPSVQTIVFPTPPFQAFGPAPFAVSATASSGLPVTFTSNTPSICDVIAGNSIHMISVGECVITASQAGNATVAPAPSVTVRISIVPGPQTINFGPLPNRPLGAPPFTISATASSGLPVVFSAYSPSTPACTVDSRNTVTLLAVGTCFIYASQNGNANYLATANVLQPFAVTGPGQLSQTVAFPDPGDQAYTLQAGFGVKATASSGLPVSFLADSAGCTIQPGTDFVFFHALGSCRITAFQDGSAAYAPATPITHSFTIRPGSQTVSFDSPGSQVLGGGPVLLLASTTAALEVNFVSSTPAACTISGLYAILVSTGTCTVTAAPTPSPFYSAAAPVTQSFAVLPASSLVPRITQVSNAFSNIPASPIQSGSWVAIKGTNLSNTDPGRGWNANESFPTFMNGTSVTINGQAAFVYYISPTQVNVQAPTDSTLGYVTVTVTNNGAVSQTVHARYQTAAPALLQWGGGQYPYALITRGSDFIGNPDVIPNTAPAHAGDALTLWVTGLGPTNPPVSAGQQPSSFPPVIPVPTVTVGASSVTVLSAVLRYAGLYQVNIQLPASLPAGDLAVKVIQGDYQSPDGILIHTQ